MTDPTPAPTLAEQIEYARGVLGHSGDVPAVDRMFTAILASLERLQQIGGTGTGTGASGMFPEMDWTL